MAMKYLFIIPAAMALFIAGCSLTNTTMQKDFGNSVKTNIAKHTINPNEGREELATATVDGHKAENSLKTYSQDTGKASSGRLAEDMDEQGWRVKRKTKGVCNLKKKPVRYQT